MSRTPDSRLITSLDIGTSKVVAMVSEVDENGHFQVIGVGEQPSRGLKKGVIVNIEATVNAIQKAIVDAELMADCQINSVVVGISGAHIHSFNSTGVVAIRDQEVSDSDVGRVIEAAKAVAIPADQRILHILPQEFVIDSQEGIQEPVGMSGVRLEAKVHMVTGSVTAAQNIVKCVRHCGLAVTDIVLDQLASSYSVLSEDEKELGVCLVDIGDGTTDIAVFSDGAIRHTSVIPIGGSQVTNDIAHALRTPTQYAEAIKLDHGVALAKLASPEQTVEIHGVGDRPGRRLAMHALAGVVESRSEELFNLVAQDVRNSGFSDSIGAGYVLTGGASKMLGLANLAEEVFRMPVKLSGPQTVRGLQDSIKDPAYSVAVGLLQYSYQQQEDSLQFETVGRDEDEADSTLSRMKAWFSKHF